MWLNQGMEVIDMEEHGASAPCLTCLDLRKGRVGIPKEDVEDCIAFSGLSFVLYHSPHVAYWDLCKLSSKDDGIIINI